MLPKRWIVERTFAWLDINRRNSKDYERHTESSQAIIHLAAIRLMILKSYSFLDIETMTADGLHLDAVGSRKLIEPVVTLMMK